MKTKTKTTRAKTMHRQRLQLMCTLLAEVEAGTWEPTGTRPDGTPLPHRWRPEHLFDLNEWLILVRPDCGFSACAIGHACLDRRFNAEGLFMQFGASELHSMPPSYQHDGQQLLTWGAVMTFFGLTQWQTFHLFDGDKYPTTEHTNPAAVRQRIEALLAAD
jgi:hypothetical protein